VHSVGCQLAEDCRVFVIAVTRKRDDVNSALTVSTRISLELEMSVPNPVQRCAVGVCILMDRLISCGILNWLFVLF